MIKLYIDKFKSTENFINDIIKDHQDKYFLHYDIKRINGKPVLSNIDFHFIISHTDYEIGCAVSNKKIGLDIEKIKPFDYSKIIKRLNLKYYKEFLNDIDSLENFYFSLD
jgi:phosphopantetheinyl transferase